MDEPYHFTIRPKAYWYPITHTWKTRLRNRTIKRSGFSDVVTRKVFGLPKLRVFKRRAQLKVDGYQMRYLDLVHRLHKRLTQGTTLAKHRHLVSLKVACALRRSL